jgi:hypothetical protein
MDPRLKRDAQLIGRAAGEVDAICIGVAPDEHSRVKGLPKGTHCASAGCDGPRDVAAKTVAPTTIETHR